MVSKTYIKKIIFDLYWKEKKSTTQVAKEIGWKQPNVITFMMRNKIPIRSKSEAVKLWWKKQILREKLREVEEKNGSNRTY